MAAKRRLINIGVNPCFMSACGWTWQSTQSLEEMSGEALDQLGLVGGWNDGSHGPGCHAMWYRCPSRAPAAAASC